MALNREKVIQAAEKYVAKGRVEGAIKEYRKLLEENPNDISTLNRVGDLYARIDRSDEAARLFLQIAQTYTADGFFVKAIAIYKKIIKLDPTRLEIYEKLAELYARQGLVNEARAQYQVLADYYAKHQNAASAIAVHNRMVELEPENPTYHAKLAELYQSQGLIDKAMAEYRIIAELMLKFARPEEASKVYHKALEISAADLGFVTDAVLALRTAGQNGLAAKLLAAAVEKNPQAERVASITGLRQTGSIPVMSAEAEAAPAPPSRPPIAAPPPAPRPAPHPAAGAPAAAPPARPTPAPTSPPVAPPPVAAAPVAAAAVAPVTPAPPVAVSPAHVAPPAAAPPPAPTPASDEDVFELDLDLETDLTFDLDSVEPARTQIQPPADLEGTGPGRAFAAQAAAEAAEIEWELDLEGDAEGVPSPEPPVDEPAPPGMLGEEWQDVEAAAAEVERGMGTQSAPPLDEEVVELDLDAYDGVDLEQLALGVAGASAPSAMLPGPEPPLDEAVTLEELEVEAGVEVEAASAIEPAAGLPIEPAVDEPPPTAAVTAGAGEVELELDLEDEVGAQRAEPVVVPLAGSPAFPAAPPSGELGDEPPPAEPDAAAPAAVVPPPAPAARPAPAVAVEAERRPEDLLAEAEVFAKYGLREKALDRLHQVLAADPENFDAQAQRLLLAADGGDSERVQELARGVRDLAARKDLGDRWEKVRARLAKQGFQIADAGELRAAPVKKKPDDRISQLLESLVDVPKRKLTTLPTPAKRTAEEVEDALAGLLGAAKAPSGPPPAAEPAARPVTPPPSAGPGQPAVPAPPPAVAAPTPAPRPTPPPLSRPAAAPPPRPVAAPPSPAVAAAAASELEAPPPPSPAAPPSRFHAELDEELEGFELPRQLAPHEVHARQLDDTGNLSWLDEAAAPGGAEAGGDSGGALFDEEEFFDLAAELEEELSDEAAGASDLLVQPQEQSLEEIVEGFKKGVAEHLSAEDYATHYNLGIAYREMGLLDEAIGEFQLAAKDPAHLADCCAMLGLSFVDKGLPELAVKWFKRGLEAPTVAEESMLGLLYDLGDVYMMLGDWDSARKTFVELYGINSNYRDVVAKLAELEPQ